MVPYSREYVARCRSESWSRVRVKDVLEEEEVNEYSPAPVNKI